MTIMISRLEIESQNIAVVYSRHITNSRMLASHKACESLAWYSFCQSEFRDPLHPLCRQVWHRRSGQCGICWGFSACSRSTCLPTPFVAFIKRAAKLLDKG